VFNTLAIFLRTDVPYFIEYSAHFFTRIMGTKS